MIPRKRRDDFYRDRRRRKVCSFCADKSKSIDYKEVNRLRRFISERAKIEPRRKTGTCAQHQRALVSGAEACPPRGPAAVRPAAHASLASLAANAKARS